MPNLRARQNREQFDRVDLVPLGHGEQFERVQLEELEEAPPPDHGPELYGGLTPDVDARLTLSNEFIGTYIAKVERNRTAVEILAELYEQRVLSKDNFGDHIEWSQGVALALLAASHLADVDVDAVRLRDEGEAYIEKMIAFART